MWFLTERLGLTPIMRNEASEPHSVCDAVGDAFGMGYKNTERVWTGRTEIFRRHWPLFMTIWAELPSATLLGVRQPINN